MHTPSNTVSNETTSIETPAIVSVPASNEAAKPVTAKRNNAAKRTVSVPATAKPVKAVKQAAIDEAKPDPRAAKAERTLAERTVIAALYAGLEANRVSVPVKALSVFKPQTTTPHPIARNPSIRQAAAIAACFAAANVKLADGAKAPRVFDYKNVRSAIENGVLRDAVSSGLIRVSGATPETEMLQLTKIAVASITGFLSAKTLKAAKLI